MPKRVATIQVDLDGLWTNLEYYGYNHPIENDEIYATALPRFQQLFAKYNIKATFFTIGKDVEVPWKAKLLRELVQAGHELANHTYSHPFGLRMLSRDQKEQEIIKGAEAIAKITGSKPTGFKAPGYDIDGETLNLLASHNYLYDSSVIPTFAYPLLMQVNRLLSGGKKRTHGPKWSWGRAPHNLYHPSEKSERIPGNLNITELPCTVMPFLRLPYHTTFALRFGTSYFKLGYHLTRLHNLSFNYEFHAADLADDITDQRLAHLTKVPFAKRLKICEMILAKIKKDYDVVTSTNFIHEYHH